eukprot:2588109-Amphidinium_carterae.3
MIYRVWAAWQKPRILAWRDTCIFRGETPVGRGALDEAFTLAHQAEQATLEGVPFAAVFLDCSKCYERVDLSLLEESVRAAGFPLPALCLAVDMYRGRRRILVNGAVSQTVSDPVEASSGIPAGCGLAVDLLHAFLQHKIHASELRVSVRKYVDDMVLSASGKGCAYALREAFRAIKRVLEASGMRLKFKQDQVRGSGKHQCMPHRMPQSLAPNGCRLGTLEKPGTAGQNPVIQQGHDAGANVESGFCTPLLSTARRSPGSRSPRLVIKVRTAARRALGRGTQLRRAAELELTLKGGLKAHPQVAFDLYTIRAWQRACGNMHVWPPPDRQWDKVDTGRAGRGPLRHLKTLCVRLRWTPQPQGFLTPEGSITWADADYYVVV